MGVPYGPSGLNMPLSLDHNPYSITQFPFLATLELPNLRRFTNDPVQHHLAWPTILVKLPKDIPKLDGKPREDLKTHITTYHMWCISNSLLDDII